MSFWIDRCFLRACVLIWWVLLAVSLQAVVVVAQEDRRPVVTVYTADYCEPCKRFESELRSGMFRNLNCRFQNYNCSRNPPPADFIGAPSFRIERGPMITVTPYSGQRVFNELYDRLTVSGPVNSDKLSVIHGQSTGQQSQGSGSRSAPVQAAPAPVSDPAVDIDWSGVRFGVLVGPKAPLTAGWLRGPTQSLLDIASGGQCRMEVIHEEDEPKRFAAVAQALEVEPYTITVYPFMTFDRVADVNFVRGLVLKKIETVIDNKVHGEDISLVPDMIFRRVSAAKWERVVQALSVVDPTASVSVPAKESPVASEPEQQSHSVVGFLLAMLAGMKVTRVVRALWNSSRDKLLDQVELDSSATIPAPHVRPAGTIGGSIPATSSAPAPVSAPQVRAPAVPTVQAAAPAVPQADPVTKSQTPNGPPAAP